MRRAGRALKLGRSLTSLVMGGVTTGVVLVLWMLVDSRAHFGMVGRWAGFVAAALPLFAAVVWALRVSLRKLDEAALARRLETATGRNDNALVNAVQLDRALADSSPWRNVLLGELAGLWSHIPWEKVYNWKLLKRAAWGAGVLFMLGLVGFAWRPTEFRQRLGRVLMPAKEIAPVTRTHVTGVTPGNRVVARGTVLTMGVDLTGNAPSEVWLVITKADGTVERQMAKRSGQSLSWTVDHKWLDGGTYGFEAGDARSFDRKIEVRVPAKVVSRRLAVTAPAYT